MNHLGSHPLLKQHNPRPNRPVAEACPRQQSLFLALRQFLNQGQFHCSQTCSVERTCHCPELCAGAVGRPEVLSAFRARMLQTLTCTRQPKPPCARAMHGGVHAHATPPPQPEPMTSQGIQTHPSHCGVRRSFGGCPPWREPTCAGSKMPTGALISPSMPWKSARKLETQVVSRVLGTACCGSSATHEKQGREDGMCPSMPRAPTEAAGASGSV